MEVSERISPADELPHVASQGRLLIVQDLDLLAEHVAPPLPLPHLPPPLTAEVSDEVDRLTLSLCTPDLPQSIRPSPDLF